MERLEPLSKEHVLLVEEEIEKYKMDLDEEIDKIIEWINQQPHLPKYLDNKQKIKNFMFANKFSIQRTKKTVDFYYSVRRVLPEFFKNRDPEHLSVQNALKEIRLCCFPKPVSEGYRILFAGNRNINWDELDTDAAAKTVVMLDELLLLEDFTRGLILMIDMDRVPLSAAKFLSMPVARKTAFLASKCFPMRIKGIYIINVQPFLDPFVNMFMYFLPDKIKTRVHVLYQGQGHGAIIDLLGESDCPKEYGGKSDLTVDDYCDFVKKLLEKRRKWYIRESERLTDESKRIHPIFQPEDSIFGLSGSFRKLNLD